MEKSTDAAYGIKQFLPEKLFWSISLFFLLLPVLFAMAPSLFHQSGGFFLSGDKALLQMATEEVPDGIYTGAYSRFGFHHPGPLYFYIRYPFSMDGNQLLSLYFLPQLIAGFSLWGIFHITRKTVSDNAAVLFAVLISSLMYGMNWSIWSGMWNPYVVVLPMLLSIVAMVAVAGGANKYLPVAVVSASFAAQTHLGVLPVMGLLLLYTFALMVYRRDFRNRFFTVSLVIAFVLWIPVIVDQLSPYGTGNLSSIFSFLRETEPAGICNNSISVWSSLASMMETAPLASFLRVSSNFMVLINSVVALIRSLFLFSAWLTARRRNTSSFETRLCEVTLLLLIASVASVYGIRGLVEQYLARWISLLSPLSWLAIILVYRKRLSSGKRKILFSMLPVLLILFTVMNVHQVASESFASDPRGYHDEKVKSLSIMLLEDHELLLSDQIQITVEDNSLWPYMAGLVCNLRTHGYQVAIQDEYAYMLNKPNPVFSRPLVIHLYHSGSGIDYRMERTDSSD
ncbi:MAG: glycosyltransferase family 39 protein [Candidatus Sabulitectum sp.]|nr:glycosyltransferase family 39 protein [Candidatus Sabulitectum sp.]